MPKKNDPVHAAVTTLRSEQQKLILATAESGTLPSSSTIERIARLEDQIFGLEHVREYVDSHKAR